VRFGVTWIVKEVTAIRVICGSHVRAHMGVFRCAFLGRTLIDVSASLGGLAQLTAVHNV
jgi:hypothetical protein